LTAICYTIANGHDKAVPTASVADLFARLDYVQPLWDARGRHTASLIRFAGEKTRIIVERDRRRHLAEEVCG
jgi:hypothetical protein